MKSFFLTLTIISQWTLASCIASEPLKQPVSIKTPIKIKTLFQGNDVIWGFDFLNPKEIIFTERKGSMRIIDIQTEKAKTIGNVPSTVQHGQGGLMDVVLHPDFSKNHWIYFSYTVKENQFFETRISRAKLIKDRLENLEVLFTSNAKSSRGEHFGSRIVFDNDGHIFFTIGERGHRDNSQNLQNSAGKVLRLMEDGKIPTDNPFVQLKTAVGAIWSYGHRNPQGLYYDHATKTLWEQEHGPKGGDEINIVEKGKNYGWPVITYGREYYGPKIGTTEKQGMKQPRYYFVPSIAPSGLTMYKGDLYSGALALMHLNRLVLEGQNIVREERLLEDLHERIRHVRVGPDDTLYISTDSGKIMRIKL